MKGRSQKKYILPSIFLTLVYWTLVPSPEEVDVSGNHVTVIQHEPEVIKNQREIALDDLVINEKNDRRMITHKDEGAGLEDIRGLISSNDIGEVWMYLPSDEKWVECGVTWVNKGPQRKDGTFPLDPFVVDNPRAIADYVKRYSDVVFYRLKQPEPITRILAENNLSHEEVTTRLSESIKDDVLPSATDLMFAGQIARLFYAFHPYGELSFRTVSSHGVTAYSLSDNGRAKIERGDGVDAFIYMAALDYESVKKPDFLNQMIRTYFDGGDFSVSFKPFERAIR